MRFNLMKRKFLTEKELKRVGPGSPYYVEKGTYLTPLAQEVARQRNNAIIECESLDEIRSFRANNKILSIAANSQGGILKGSLISLVKDIGYLVYDCGTSNDDSSDYARSVLEVLTLIQTGKAGSGILVDSDGIGSCVIANKACGIRAAHCYDRATAAKSRESHNSNLLVLAAPLLDRDLGNLIVTTWLETPFLEKNNQITLIEQVEKKLSQQTIVAVPGDCSCAL